MKFLTYGEKSNPAILLIHGMGCTAAQSFASAREKLENRYHVIMPCLDGYDGTSSTFSSMAEQAEKIAAYLKETDAERLYMVLGMSMGGFIAMELLCKYAVTTNILILDSGYLKKQYFAKPVAAFVAYGFSKLIAGKDNAFIRGAMKRMMGFSFRKDDLCASATKETIYNSEYTCLSYQLPNLMRLASTKLQYWYGSREPFMIKGMRVLKKHMPHMEEICLGDYGHGEIMATNPSLYAALIENAAEAWRKQGFVSRSEGQKV